MGAGDSIFKALQELREERGQGRKGISGKEEQMEGERAQLHRSPDTPESLARERGVFRGRDWGLFKAKRGKQRGRKSGGGKEPVNKHLDPLPC